MSVFDGQFPQWLYLIAFNAVSALLWAFIFSRAALTALTGNGLDSVYPAVRRPVLLTQTAAFLEVLHALTGLVHARVAPTVVQVAGRSAVLWAVLEARPAAAPAAALVLAWSAADAVRHLYFAARLVGGGGLRLRRLAWARYSAFYVLYPAGILSEVALVGLAVGDAWGRGQHGRAAAYMAAAMLYIPAAPTLFNHMRRQRRKALTPKKGQNTYPTVF